MGRRGPKPTPTVIQLAKGDPGKRARRRVGTEPQPKGYPTAPRWLSREAASEWKRILRLAADLGGNGSEWITKADRAALAAYCQCYADYVQAEIKIRENGAVMEIETERGLYRQQTPWVSIKRGALDKMIQLANEFGFTPAARTRVNLKTEKEVEDSVEKAMFGG